MVVVIDLAMDAPKTKAMVAMLHALGVDAHSVLLVMGEREPNVQRSAHNLPQVKTVLSGYINVKDLLGYDVLVMAQEAVMHVEEWLGADVVEIIWTDEGEAAGDETIHGEADEAEDVREMMLAGAAPTAGAMASGTPADEMAEAAAAEAEIAADDVVADGVAADEAAVDEEE